MELEDYKNENINLKARIEQLESENNSLVEKNKELLKEKKDFKAKYEGAVTDESDRIKNLQTRFDQLEEKYQQAEKESKERAKKLKEQSILSAITTEFSSVCHNPKEFAQLLRFQNIATSNDEGEPVILWEGQEISVTDFKSKAIENTAWQHHFKPRNSQGTGMNFNNESGSTVKNPWSKETFNLTEQMKLIKSNPSLATRLRKEAQ